MSQTQQIMRPSEENGAAQKPPADEASGLEYCPICQRGYKHKDYLDHLFQNKECMRSYWQEEERTHAYRVRHRSLNRKKEREALARQRRPDPFDPVFA
ncbi:MAG: hypothetical protein ACYCQJ_09450 [Nitrososphaerales archaeon]